MRRAGCDHGIENRFSMCGLICEPRPSENRPFDICCRSLAVYASTIGVRANATAMPVASSMRSVCSAASAIGRNASWPVSAVSRPSYPSSSSSRARGPISPSDGAITPVSTFISGSRSHLGYRALGEAWTGT